MAYHLTNKESSAASAIAANTVIRSIVAASFPLFSRQMFNNMRIQWAGTLLGCVATVLVPIPIYFWFFGSKLRRKSQFAPILEPEWTRGEDIDNEIPPEAGVEEQGR